MKSPLLIAGAVALIISFPIAATAASSAPAQAGVEKPSTGNPAPVNVDVLLSNPDSYKGTVTVRGVVSSVFPNEKRLGLIDAVYLNCCSSPCGSIQALPVKWKGDMPTMKSLVMVTGEIQRTGERLEFVAKKIDKAEATAETTK